MAEITVEKKKSPDLTWLWAAGAVLAILGLMTWLFMSQETTTQVITAEQEAAEAPAAPAPAEGVEIAALGADPAAYQGREVELVDVSVAAILGPRGLWVDAPGQNPVLVILGAGVPDGVFIQEGQEMTIEGTVEPVTDAELNRWVQEFVILETSRDEASFASHYVHAQRVETE